MTVIDSIPLVEAISQKILPKSQNIPTDDVINATLLGDTDITNHELYSNHLSNCFLLAVISPEHFLLQLSMISLSKDVLLLTKPTLP